MTGWPAYMAGRYCFQKYSMDLSERLNEVLEVLSEAKSLKGYLPKPWGVLYAKPNPDNSRKKCDNCFMFIKDLEQCEIHASNIMVTKDMICVAPETLLNIGGNFKYAWEVKEGDLALTHKNRFRKITKIFKREYDGELILIKPCGLRPILVTPNHPFYAIQHKRKWFNDEKRSYVPSPFRDVFEASWIEAKDIRRRDIVLYSTSALLDESSKMEVGENLINVNRNTLRLIGFFITEGYVVHNRGKLTGRIGFVLNKSEISYADEIIQTLQNEFGITTKIRILPHRTAKSINIILNNMVLAKFLKDNCGAGASRKKIPHFIMIGSTSQKAHLLSSMWDGDGSTCISKAYRTGNKTETAKYTTVSEILAQQLALVLRCLKFGATIAYTPPKPNYDGWGKRKAVYRIYVSGISEVSKLMKFLYEQQERIDQNPKQREDGLWRLPVRQIENIRYVGPVYNFAVEEDESYTTTGGTVHNCGYHVFGKSHKGRMFKDDNVEIQPVDPKTSGLETVKGGTSCDICEYYKKINEEKGTCRVVQQDAGGKAIGKLEVVDAFGCCARWEAK
jgi:intein/homing endonuclease